MSNLPTLLSLLQDAAICAGLLFLLALCSWAMVKLDTPPAPDAEEEDTDEEADALPFGPTPPSTD